VSHNTGVVTVYDQIYAVGGDDGTTNLQTVEIYHPQTDKWTRLPIDMPICRSYAGIAVMNKLL
jgi:kelch-like protein 2/3